MVETSDFIDSDSDIDFDIEGCEFEDSKSEAIRAGGDMRAGGDVRARKSTFLSLQSINGLMCSSQGIPRIMV